MSESGVAQPGVDANSLGYAEAIAELNAILAALDDDSLDIDQLGEKVARAAVLITLCRDRIGVARDAVDQVVATLDESGVE